MLKEIVLPKVDDKSLVQQEAGPLHQSSQGNRESSSQFKKNGTSRYRLATRRVRDL